MDNGELAMFFSVLLHSLEASASKVSSIRGMVCGRPLVMIGTTARWRILPRNNPPTCQFDALMCGDVAESQ